MTRMSSRAIRYVVILASACLWLMPARAQEPVGGQEGMAATAPASSPSNGGKLPEAYRIDLNKMLIYQVRMNSRFPGPPGVMEKIDRRELALFDLDADGNVVLYMARSSETGPADERPPAAAPQHQLRRGTAASSSSTSTSETAKPEKHKLTDLLWTKYLISGPVVRNKDGTVLVRPREGANAYPVLPLPPQNVKERARYEVTVPDLAAGPDKTVDLVGRWRNVGTESISVDAQLEVKVKPGVPFVPEVAVFGYEIPRINPGGVARIHESRKPAGRGPACRQPNGCRSFRTPRQSPRRLGDSRQCGKRRTERFALCYRPDRSGKDHVPQRRGAPGHGVGGQPCAQSRQRRRG